VIPCVVLILDWSFRAKRRINTPFSQPRRNSMLRYATALLLVGVLAIGLVNAGGANKLEIGAPAPTFTGLPGIDGKKYSLGDFKDKDVLVVCITCNHCPVAVAYEDRMIDFAKKHAGDKGKVAFVAINVNTGEADRLDKMQIRAKERGFNFTYLYDESQQIARALNASVTPEFYVFNKERKLVYWGSMDDRQNEPTKSYLEPAVQSALKGETPVVARTKAFGCGVQYNAKN